MNHWVKKLLVPTIAILIIGGAGSYIAFSSTNINTRLITNLVADKIDGDPDLIIVLGGGITEDSNVSDLSKERIDHALEIYKETKKPILFSGGKTPSGIEAIVMNEYASQNGYKEVDLIEGRSKSTWQNAEYSTLLLKDVNVPIDTVMIVTSPYHSRRALAVFRQFMPQRVVLLSYPDESVILDNAPLSRLKSFYRLVREYAATYWYQSRYGVIIVQ